MAAKLSSESPDRVGEQLAKLELELVNARSRYVCSRHLQRSLGPTRAPRELPRRQLSS